jgi:sialic acid synthase SpsE
MKIGSVDLDQQVYVIAEIGGNHNGDPETAYKLVEEAAKAGASAVKFQTYEAEKLVHPSVEPVPIVKKHYDTQLERFKSLELSWEVYEIIMQMCENLNIDFLTTPFDLGVLEKFEPYMPAIKISSGDLNYEELIHKSVISGKPVLVSTGMAEMDEIQRVAEIVPLEQLSLMHCVSVYPLPDDRVNLLAIKTMKEAWPELPIGYSDHSIGIDACLSAVTLGARIIEKHYTLDKSQVPGDHVLSADPEDLKVLVDKSKRILELLGDGVKIPQEGEASMRHKMRRGLYAARDLAVGETVSKDDIMVIRPETEFAPAEMELLVGTKLTRVVKKYEAFEKRDVQEC